MLYQKYHVGPYLRLNITFPPALSVSGLFDLFQQELNISTCAVSSRLSRRISGPWKDSMISCVKIDLETKLKGDEGTINLDESSIFIP